MKPIYTFETFLPVLFAVAQVGIAFLFIYGAFLFIKVKTIRWLNKKKISKKK